MTPDLRELRYFVAVAEELSFTHAARRLHVSQPSLSTTIRQLETRLGLQLLVRTTRRVDLTPAGVTLRAPLVRAFRETAARIATALLDHVPGAIAPGAAVQGIGA
jgi:DNA-binding transcriptional LysR family regulator